MDDHRTGPLHPFVYKMWRDMGERSPFNILNVDALCVIYPDQKYPQVNLYQPQFFSRTLQPIQGTQKYLCMITEKQQTIV